MLALIAAVAAVSALVVWIKYVKQGPVFKGKVSLDGKTVLVTGGSDGIGKETALQLAKLKARVIIASRSEHKAAEAIFDIKTMSGNDMVHFMPLDLSNFSNVRLFAKEFLTTEPRLDILVNNAGVVSRGIASDGNDFIVSTNHLGPFLLTNLLMPLLKETAEMNPVRIVNVSADAYHMGNINLERINMGLDESCPITKLIQQYCNTKLMNIYFTSELHRRLRQEDPGGNRISTFALHPGVISSNFASDLTQSNLFLRFCRQFLFFSGARPLFYGCQTILYCCLREGLESKSGCYFSDLKQRKLAPHARDAKIAERLWELSWNLTDL